MRKIHKVLFLCLLFAASLTVGVAAAFAADDDIVTVKSLVSTGSMVAGQIEWSEAGAPDSWPGAVEEIKDAAQADGGDVILRTELSADGKSLVTGQYGFARQSTNAALCAYPMSGLTMKFYAQKSDFMLIFTENSGWYGGSTYHWSLWFTGGSVALRKCTTGGDNMVGVGNATSGLKLDYDYFKDPDTEGYANVGDTSQQFVGTQNVLEIKNEGGSALLYLNGKELFNLTEKGIVSEVFNHFNSAGAFVCFYGTAAVQQAIKITDIYNVSSSWTEGLPATYTLLSGGAEYKADESSNVGFRSKSPDFAYAAKYNTKQYMQDLTLGFYYAGNDLTAGDALNVRLLDSADGGTSYLNMQFAKKTVNTAELTVSTFDGTDERVLGKTDVSLYYNGSALNTVSLKETVPFVLTVNEQVADIDLTALSSFKDAFTDAKASVVYAVEESAAAVLTPVSYVSKAVEELESAEGLPVVEGKPVIKSDDGYAMFYNNDDSLYAVRYDANELIAGSFELTYRLGKYGTTNQAFRVTVGNETAGIAFLISYVDDASAKLGLYTVDGGKETKLGEETVDYRWQYSAGNKKLSFVKSGASGYLAFVDGSIALQISDEATIAAVDAVLAKIEGGMAKAEFKVLGDALTAFAFVDYEYFVPTTIAPGWGEGAIPATQFGYAAGANTVISFGSYSYQKGTEVLVDGFRMNFKTYVKAGGSAPTWALSTVSSWYSNHSAIQFSVGKKSADKATFSLNYTNKVEGDYEFIAANKENSGITSFAVDWNWNNGADNVIELKLTDGVWRWTVNGTELVPDEKQPEYSDYYKELYALYPSANKTAVLQAYGGSKTVYDISSIAEFVPNVDPVVSHPIDSADRTVGDKISVDLNEVFSDANGDELTFALEESSTYQGTIANGVWTFDCTEAGSYTVKITAYDGNGGEVTHTVTFQVKAKTNTTDDKKGGKGGCGGSAAASVAGILLVLAAATVAKRTL